MRSENLNNSGQPEDEEKLMEWDALKDAIREMKVGEEKTFRMNGLPPMGLLMKIGFELNTEPPHGVAIIRNGSILSVLCYDIGKNGMPKCPPNS